MAQAFELGGGIVRRALNTTRDGKSVRLVRGHRLTREELLAMPPGNLNAFIATRTIEVWPLDLMQAPAAPDLELMTVQHGFGKFHVVEGRRLTEKPLDKDEAAALVEELKKKRAPQ